MFPIVHREEEWTLSRMTSMQNALHTNDPLSPNNTTSPQRNGPGTDNIKRKRFVFADPVAFRYLEDDPTVVVLERRGKLVGYELYLVEQWACSRVHPTFIITTYTGDQSHGVLVGVLGVPVDENKWSPRLRLYFDAISQYHARPKDTSLGMLMVSNLSGFPSALTVIPVPDGDIRKHREDFIVNENLKRLGCSGRSGMNLVPPSGPTQAKFYQLYKTSEQVPFYGAVIEMVKLCQVALLIFGKLEQEYADGLLCDVTEKAINDWWVEIGSEYYNAEPSDGILGPSTVSGLLGMLIGARNRLNYYGAPVAKDAFDLVALKRGIQYFQKSQKIERTRRLDRHTLNRLHTVTAKAAANEGGWAVPKAVKSTVAELSGKGGEMVMGMVGGNKDKGAIGDIETLDINNFTNLVQGERSKWLWHGKARRPGGISGDTFGRSLPEKGNAVFSKDDQGGYLWSSGHRRQESYLTADEEPDVRAKANDPFVDSQPQSSAASIQDQSAIESERESVQARRGLGRVTGKMSDARSGFGRIKDAVGLRGHTKTHKDGVHEMEHALGNTLSTNSDSALAVSPGISRTFTWKNTPDLYAEGKLKDSHRDIEPIVHSASAMELSAQNTPSKMKHANAEAWDAQRKEIRHDLITNEPSIDGSDYEKGDFEGPVLAAERSDDNSSSLLYRRSSLSSYDAIISQRNEAYWPRHMSFSNAEDAVLGWKSIGTLPDPSPKIDNFTALQTHRLKAFDQQTLHQKLSRFRTQSLTWVDSCVSAIEDLDTHATQEESEIQELYFRLSEAYSAVRSRSDGLLGDERSRVTEAIKDIEVLGAKLEYEINALVSKVDDLKDGVETFEAHVGELETRTRLLDVVLGGESWAGWLWRMMTGAGKTV